MFQAEVVEEIKTHLSCLNPPSDYRAVSEIMWKNTVEPGTPQMTIWRLRFPCWTTKVTQTLTICIAYRFPTTTMLTRARLNVTLYVMPVLLNSFLIYFVSCNWVVTRWQYTFTHKQYIEQYKTNNTYNNTTILPQRGACITTGCLRMTFCICTDPKDFGCHLTLPTLSLRLQKHISL